MPAEEYRPKMDRMPLSEYYRYRDERLRASEIFDHGSFAVAFLIKGELMRLGASTSIVSGGLRYDRPDRLDLNLYFRDDEGLQTQHLWRGFIDYRDNLWYSPEGITSPVESADSGLSGSIEEGYLLQLNDNFQDIEEIFALVEAQHKADVARRGMLSAS